MVALKNLLYLITAVSAAVLPRTAQSIVHDIQTLSTDFVDLGNAAARFTGGPITGKAYHDKFNDVILQVKTSTQTAINSAALTRLEVYNILEELQDKLAPSVSGALGSILAKKSVFVKAKLKNTQLELLEGAWREILVLSDVLSAKSPEPGKHRLIQVLSHFANDLSGAAAAFE